MSPPRHRGHRRAGPLPAHREARAFGLGEASIAAIAAAASVAVSAAGTAAGMAVSSSQARQTAERNQELADQQAELARRAGKAAEADSREETSRLRAMQRAQLSDSGIDSSFGSPLLLLLDASAQSEIAAQRARYSGQVEEHAQRANANLYRLQGQQAALRGGIGVGTTLLTGAVNAGAAYAKYSKSPNPSWSSSLSGT